MKLSLVSIVALLGVTAAAASSSGAASEGSQVKVKRQRPAVEAAVMADANGDVIPYSRQKVAQNKQRRKAKRTAPGKVQAW